MERFIARLITDVTVLYLSVFSSQPEFQGADVNHHRIPPHGNTGISPCFHLLMLLLKSGRVGESGL